MSGASDELRYFYDIAPYLTHPLVLVGFALLLVFGVHRALLKSHLLRPLSRDSSRVILRLLLHYGFIIAVLLILAGFGLAFLRESHFQISATNPTPGSVLSSSKLPQPQNPSATASHAMPQKTAAMSHSENNSPSRSDAMARQPSPDEHRKAANAVGTTSVPDLGAVQRKDLPTETRVVFDVGQGYLAPKTGQGYGYNIRYGQMLIVEAREGEYLRLRTRDGLHVGYMHETRVAAQDPKSYFVLSIGDQRLPVYLNPRCSSWQGLDRLSDFETQIGTTSLPLSSIDSMSVTALVTLDPNPPHFKATVTLKDGNRITGTFCGADFYRGTSEALHAAEGLELNLGERVPWTIKAIDRP